MKQKPEKTIILDLTQIKHSSVSPICSENNVTNFFEFWTEKGERVNNLERIDFDTQKIVMKTDKGIQSLKISENMQKNLLEYFKRKNRGAFKNFTYHEFNDYIVHGLPNKVSTYNIKKTNKFEIGDTILLGKFIKIFWKTFTIHIQHSAICIAQTEEGPLYISKLDNKKLVIVTNLSELQKIYPSTVSYAKKTWKN